ncbi:hypothetical protein TTHERM_00840010 (macronuclear) [Tetrahymena thermophila SB210]|uniref:Uncharacterized protein n=1 Tax=Tetrahymena thermophila (strain SB210) TaxID=312017 RepID=I7LXP2_TETTS|nr:hypothetical protein TTHERM_00840010 [Tetrahymena thermophila SB210]EAS05032.1 hypothetical protein TTHERM_00840010 [Tetrahymena thermophila SB210]|eukprot:XP_001025277.1 hypothetical protein TTHERM_00840010 [Tetrahymena thermophila SB210]
MSLNQLEKTTTKEEIIEQIQGYKVVLQTPYGKLQSLPADLYSNGRNIKVIEQNIDKFVRPFQSSSYYDQQIRNQIVNSCQQAIFKNLNCSSQVHTCLAFQAQKNMDSFVYISNLFLNLVNTESQDVKINVYIQNYQSYKNVFPWLMIAERMRLVTIETDTYGNIQQNSIVNTVVNHIKETKYHIIQVKSTSSKTNEPLKIEDIINQVEALRKEYPECQFYTILDASQIVFQKQQENAFSYFDFISISSSEILGGQMAANLLIARKDILTKFAQVDLQKNLFQADSEQLLRICQALEYCNLNNIQSMIDSSENSKFFYDEMQKVNQALQAQSVLMKIDLGNIQSANTKGKYSILMYIEGGESFVDDKEHEGNGRPILQSRFLAQFLNDFFGIQVKCNNQVKTPSGFYFSDIPQNLCETLGMDQQNEFKQINSSTIELDIHFLLTKDEIQYITQALKLIAQNALKIIKYYQNTTQQLKLYVPPEYDFSLVASLSFQGNVNNFKPIKEKYEEQIQAVTKLMKNPDNFYSLQEGWSEEKTVIFPINSYDEYIPKKPKLQLSRQAIQSKIETEVAEENQKRNSLINEESVKSFKQKILQIQKDEEKKVETVIQKIQEDPKKDEQIQELKQKLKELEIQSRAKAEDQKKIRQEIKQEVEKELRHKLQIEKDYQFHNTLVQKEKRIKNLNKIFQFYSNLVDYLEQKKEPEQIINVKQRKNKREQVIVEKPKSLTLNRFLKFCNDFELINQELDIKTLYQLFNKVGSTLGEILFEEFQVLLEKMAQVFYEKSDKLFNQFDRIEQFYRHIGLDDFKLFKNKMKQEGLAQFSFIFHDKYKIYNQGHVIPNNPEFLMFNPRFIENDQSPIHKGLNKKQSNDKDELDWNTQSVQINPKTILNDKFISQDELFTEIALQSNATLSTKQPYQSNLSSARMQNSNQNQIYSQILGKNNQQSAQNLIQIPNYYKYSPQSPESSKLSKQSDHSKVMSNKSDIFSNQYSSPQYNSLQQKQEQPDINYFSDNNYQADQRKQKLLLRAKQIYEQERDKESYRLKSLQSESPNVYSNIKQSPYKLQDQYNQYQVKQGNKQEYISQSQMLPTNNHYNHQQGLYQNYKNQYKGQQKR